MPPQHLINRKNHIRKKKILNRWFLSQKKWIFFKIKSQKSIIFLHFRSIQTHSNKEKLVGKWTKPTINKTQIKHTKWNRAFIYQIRCNKDHKWDPKQSNHNNKTKQNEKVHLSPPLVKIFMQDRFLVPSLEMIA